MVEPRVMPKVMWPGRFLASATRSAMEVHLVLGSGADQIGAKDDAAYRLEIPIVDIADASIVGALDIVVNRIGHGIA